MVKSELSCSPPRWRDGQSRLREVGYATPRNTDPFSSPPRKNGSRWQPPSLSFRQQREVRRGVKGQGHLWLHLAGRFRESLQLKVPSAAAALRHRNWTTNTINQPPRGHQRWEKEAGCKSPPWTPPLTLALYSPWNMTQRLWREVIYSLKVGRWLSSLSHRHVQTWLGSARLGSARQGFGSSLQQHGFSSTELQLQWVLQNKSPPCLLSYLEAFNSEWCCWRSWRRKALQLHMKLKQMENIHVDFSLDWRLKWFTHAAHLGLK